MNEQESTIPEQITELLIAYDDQQVLYQTQATRFRDAHAEIARTCSQQAAAAEDANTQMINAHTRMVSLKTQLDEKIVLARNRTTTR